MMKNLRFIFAMMVVLLTLAFSNAKAQPPESCLFELPFMYLGLSKPDSSKLIPTLYVDTCGIRQAWKEVCPYNDDKEFYKNYDTAYYYFTKGKVETQMGDDWQVVDYYYQTIRDMKRIYATGIFTFTFLVASPFDTTGKDLNKMYYFEVTDISNQYEALKNKFIKMEEKYGKIKFYLSKDNLSINISKLYKFWSNESYFGTYVVFDNPINAFQFEVDNQNIDGCLADFHCHMSHTTGIVETTTFQPFKISPNPAQNKLTISTDELIPNELIKIYSMDGILVRELNFQSEIDISDLNSGVYFIKYGIQSGKFVKE